MEVASINVAPWRGNSLLRRLSNCGLLCGLDDDIHFVMPQGDPCWTLKDYISFSLWVNGSTFTMDEVDVKYNIQS